SPHARGYQTGQNGLDTFEFPDGNIAVIVTDSTARLDPQLPPDAGRADYEHIAGLTREPLIRAGADTPAARGTDRPAPLPDDAGRPRPAGARGRGWAGVLRPSQVRLTSVSMCSTASRELDEPLAGTAATARTWVLLEQPGPWGAKALTSSHLDPALGRALETAAKGTGVRIALIRRTGRHADRPAGAA